VLDCPAKVFQGAGVKTVVLFFEKGRKTHRTWFYALDPERSLGKSSPLRDDELAEFIALQKTRADSAKSWTVQRGDIDAETVDMSVKNPFAPEEAPLRDPAEIIEDMLARDAETAEILAQIRGML
jgi:type I restriction enzyme M protein